MRYVIDASVAVEVLLQTTVGRHATELVAEAELVAPELLDVEVLAVLRRESLGGRLKPKRASEAVEDLGAWGILRIPHRVLTAVAWKLRHNATAYDAMYLAAARLQDTPILTVDGPLARLPVAGFVIQNLAAK
jgi:predicted nucleic acid-binding protein